ncbi:MAG: hypothetical protein LM558_01700 [Thermosphaera sp.]|nr:hypothetical protein [Thermosphaera sp.]
MSTVEVLEPQYVKTLLEAPAFLSGLGRPLVVSRDFNLSIPFLVQVVVPVEVLAEGDIYVDGELVLV